MSGELVDEDGKRKQVKLKLDEELWKTFRKFVEDMHGGYEKGLYSSEMEEAMRYYIAGKTALQRAQERFEEGPYSDKSKTNPAHTNAHKPTPVANRGTPAHGLLNTPYELTGKFDAQPPVNTIINKQNPSNKARTLRNKILVWLYESKEYNPQGMVSSPMNIKQAPKRLIVQAIEELRGYDDRTVRKWLNILYNNSILKDLDQMGNIVEIH
nr:hypothetical protein [uncultured Nitrososphaera sp.]